VPVVARVGASFTRVTAMFFVAPLLSSSPSLNLNWTVLETAGLSCVLWNLTVRIAVWKSALVAGPVSVSTPVPLL
jgi:hypothetical protein